MFKTALKAPGPLLFYNRIRSINNITIRSLFVTLSMANKDKVVSRNPSPELKVKMKKQISNTFGSFRSWIKESSEGSASVQRKTEAQRICIKDQL